MATTEKHNIISFSANVLKDVEKEIEFYPEEKRKELLKLLSRIMRRNLSLQRR